MKKTISILTFLFHSIIAFGQYNDYDRGFKNGYKEGYCYNEFGCIAPIPPITPIPLIGERNDSYQDGYNRGFKKGLEDKQSKKSNSGGYKGGQGTFAPQQQYQGSYFPAEYSLLIEAAEMHKAQNEKNEQIKKEKAIANLNQVKSYYASATNFPADIPNGWYTVISTNNYDMCDERKVYVEYGNVTKYVIDDWIDRKVSFSTKIINAKAMVQLIFDDDSKSMVDIYFLEYLNNRNAYTAPPVGSGKISFWTSWKNSGNMRIYLDGMYVGKFTNYFPKVAPSCGEEGTLTVEYKPGTYRYRAISFGGWSTKTWEGTVTINVGDCILQGLRK